VATGSYTATVSQAQIDAGVDLLNVATGDSNETDEDTDDETVDVISTPGLNVLKVADVTFVDEAGDEIVYTYTITNTGNTTLTGLTLFDDNYTPGDTSDDIPITLDFTTLLPGEVATGSYTATVSQAQIDAGVDLLNVATGDSNETDEDTDDETVDVISTPGLNVLKVADVTFVDEAGDEIVYTYTITNTGNTTLTGLTLFDDNYTPGDTSDDIPITLDFHHAAARRSGHRLLHRHGFAGADRRRCGPAERRHG